MLDDFIVSSSTAHRHPAHFAMMAREGNGFPLFEPGNVADASARNTAVLQSFEYSPSSTLGRSAGTVRAGIGQLGSGRVLILSGRGPIASIPAEVPPLRASRVRNEQYPRL
jgi:hypothetical protein